MDQHRKKALARIATPEQLNQLMRISSPVAWTWLLGLWLIILGALVWGIWGEVETTIAGPGVLIPPEGLSRVDSPHAGMVDAVFIEAGSTVEKGQVMMELVLPDKARDLDTPGSQEPERDQNGAATIRIRAPADGTVLEVDARIGNHVRMGQTVAVISPGGGEAQLAAVLYLPAATGLNIQPGMRVLVSPDMMPRAEYGAIVGRVKRISSMPVSPAAIERVVGNPLLVQQFTRKGAPIAVWIELERHGEMPGAYRWTLNSGAPIPLLGGTSCQGDIVVDAKPPLALILPIFEVWLRGRGE
jgi:biotin carboxyl carrier protein